MIVCGWPSSVSGIGVAWLPTTTLRASSTICAKTWVARAGAGVGERELRLADDLAAAGAVTATLTALAARPAVDERAGDGVGGVSASVPVPVAVTGAPCGGG